MLIAYIVHLYDKYVKKKEPPRREALWFVTYFTDSQKSAMNCSCVTGNV